MGVMPGIYRDIYTGDTWGAMDKQMDTVIMGLYRGYIGILEMQCDSCLPVKAVALISSYPTNTVNTGFTGPNPEPQRDLKIRSPRRRWGIL